MTEETYLFLSLQIPIRRTDLSFIVPSFECDGFQLIGVGGGGDWTYDYDFVGPWSSVYKSKLLLSEMLRQMNYTGEVTVQRAS